MKKGLLYSLVALGVVAILVIAAFMFTAPQDGGDVNTTITVTDMLGRNVSIPDKVNKVVAVGAGALRWVTYLQGSELVVGVEEVEQSSSPIDVGGRTYRIVNPQYGNLTVIGPQHGGDKELIASVNPDVIFKSTYESGDCDNLQNDLGIPVIGLSNKGGLGIDLGVNIENFFTQLRLVGKVLDKEDRAEVLVQNILQIKSDLNNRTKDIPASERPDVYVGGVSYSGKHGIDWTTWQYPGLMYTNSKNIITKTMLSNATVGQISVEVIFEANPDVIFIDWGGYSLCRDDYARLKSSFDSLNAFQNGSLYGVIDYNWYAANYDTLLANCYWVGKVLYPEAFEDIDPVEKANEIYQLWVGQPIYDQVVANCGGGYERVSLG